MESYWDTQTSHPWSAWDVRSKWNGRERPARPERAADEGGVVPARSQIFFRTSAPPISLGSKRIPAKDAESKLE